MHTDDFFHYLSKGAIPPHLPESNGQNAVVIEAFLEAAKRYARGGYDVIVDGIVGPWFLGPWKALVREQYEVHYIVLRASREETMRRAIATVPLGRIGTPRDVGLAAAFLVSDASAYMTVQALNVTGGQITEL